MHIPCIVFMHLCKYMVSACGEKKVYMWLYKTQPLWYNLTDFLHFKNITLEIRRLEALLCITLGSHCYNILKCINTLKGNISIFNETQQTNSLFYHFSQILKKNIWKLSHLFALSKKFEIHSNLMKIRN